MHLNDLQPVDGPCTADCAESVEIGKKIGRSSSSNGPKTLSCVSKPV